jgi:eukaryotic-like serine/threonine-protein kinase
MPVQALQAGDPELIGAYRVVRRLGSGGMGRVFLGRSPGGRMLAIKVIRAELAEDPEFRARFRREVAAARSVSGLFTAPVVDADTEAPVPWLATAYIAGSSLADTVTRHGPLPATSVLALAAGLAEGLLAIHSAGLVHRDLKPSNVLMAEDGPRVIDFGISRAMEASTVTSTGMVVGSPGFMSPEQAEGHEVGPPSDVFSLGAVLAFAATGEGPFGTGSSAALIYRLVHNPPDLDRAPIETRPLIERCLDKNPGGRPSPRELLAELGGAGLAPGWLPESLIRDISPPGPATPVPSSAVSAPPTFGSPSPPPSAPSPAETGGIMASGAWPGCTRGLSDGHLRAPEPARGTARAGRCPRCHAAWRAPAARPPAAAGHSGTRGHAGSGGRRGDRRGRQRGRRALDRAWRAEGADRGDRVALLLARRLGVGHAPPAEGPWQAERARNVDRFAHDHRDGYSWREGFTDPAHHQAGIRPQPSPSYRYMDRYLLLPPRLDRAPAGA